VILLKSPTLLQLRKLVGVANYQFGKDAGVALFDKGIRVACSKRTGRIRHIYRLRPKDGCLALTTEGAFLILSRMKQPPNVVVVLDDVADFIKAGGDVFAKHVVRADESIRPAEEAVVTNQEGILLAAGKAVLSGHDMAFFKRGVAVRVRKGTNKLPEPEQ
jgi:7-cyano-7-deazaguanine tRNA-ribosyltransferase